MKCIQKLTFDGLRDPLGGLLDSPSRDPVYDLFPQPSFLLCVWLNRQTVFSFLIRHRSSQLPPQSQPRGCRMKQNHNLDGKKLTGQFTVWNIQSEHQPDFSTEAMKIPREEQSKSSNNPSPYSLNGALLRNSSRLLISAEFPLLEPF